MSKTLLFWVFFGKATFLSTFLSTLLSKFFNNDLFWVTFLSKFTFLSPFLSIFEKNYFFEHFFEHSFGSFFGVWVFFWALFWAGSTWALFWVLFWALFWAMTSWALFWVLFWVDFWGSKAYETFMNLPHQVSCLGDHRNLFLTGGWLCLQWCRELYGTPWVLKRTQLGIRWQLWTLVVVSNMKAKYILKCANSLWRFGCLLQFQCTPSSTFSMWSTQRMWRTGRYHRFFYQICFHSPALVECSLSCCLYWSWMRDNKNNFQYLWYM